MPDKPEKKDSISTRIFSIPDQEETAVSDEDLAAQMRGLSILLERIKLSEYLAMAARPGRIWYTNFIWGLARGLGFGLGMTVLLGLSLYVLGRMVDLPLVGGFIADIVEIVQREVGNGSKF